MRISRLLGHRPWMPPSPAGFEDGDEIWAASDAVVARIDAVKLLADKIFPESGGITAMPDLVA